MSGGIVEIYFFFSIATHSLYRLESVNYSDIKMKSKRLQYFLKFYITLFSILALVSIALSISQLINREFDQILNVIKNCSTFVIFLLFGLYYEKIEHWLGLYWNKQKS
jgi:hypothetical protein